MTNVEPQPGQRFSLNYLRTNEVRRDSDRMRFRMAKLFNEHAPARNEQDVRYGRTVESELGFKVITSSPYGGYVNFEQVLKAVSMGDFLDMVTLMWRYTSRKQNFLDVARRILAETQVGYRIDDSGGAHPAFDDAYEAVRAAAVSALGGEGFEAERAYIEGAETALMANPPDGRQAIRSIFDAVEHFFKAMYQGTTHLNAASIQSGLKAEIESRYGAELHSTLRRSSLKQVDAFRSWVDSAHFYRHASGQPEPHQPSEEHTVLVVSQGLAFIRWLAVIRNQRIEAVPVD